MKKQKRYDKEYKESITQAVTLARKNGKSIAQSAKEYGIPYDTLQGWVRDYEKNGAFVGSGNIKPENEELIKLKRLNKELQEENKI